MVFLQEKSLQIIEQYQSANGAYVACPNFDQYKFCWLRDGSFIAYAMDLYGRQESARRFFLWVDHVLGVQTSRIEQLLSLAAGGRTPRPQEMLPTRYRMDGSAEEAETWPNFQLDGYGAWLWALAEHIRRTGEVGLLEELATSIRMVTEYLIRFWRLPNYDCWEEFGDQIHTSTLACLYGGIQAINQYLGDPNLEKTLQEIKTFVLENCVRNDRLVKFKGSANIDASLLWAGLPFGMLPYDGPIMQNTVTEIEKKLLHKGGVHRYPEDTYYGGGEWLLLSSWLGWYYCKIGNLAAARQMAEWVETQADGAGEMVEQVSRHVNDPSLIQPWIARWGPAAKPLLWSHAMYLVLRHEIAALQNDRAESAIAVI